MEASETEGLDCLQLKPNAAGAAAANRCAERTFNGELGGGG